MSWPSTSRSGCPIEAVDAATCWPAERSPVRLLRSSRRLPSKKTAAGREVRLAALRTWVPVELPSPPPGRAAIDDCLDALVCAWTGARWLAGEAQVLGGEVDATGQVMRIVV